MSPALFGSGSDAFYQPQVGQGGGEAPMGRGGHVALRGPNTGLLRRRAQRGALRPATPSAGKAPVNPLGDATGELGPSALARDALYHCTNARARAQSHYHWLAAHLHNALGLADGSGTSLCSPPPRPPALSPQADVGAAQVVQAHRGLP